MKRTKVTVNSPGHRSTFDRMRWCPLLFVVLGCAAGREQKTDELSGEWEGRWARDGDTIEVRQHFTRADSGYTGHFSSDALRVVNIPLSAIAAHGDSASWSVVGDESTTVFTGL